MVQILVRYFFEAISLNPTWQKAEKLGILSVPISRDWKQKPFVSHIVPLCTRPRYSYWLVFHLAFKQFTAYPVEYPVVPKGQSRVRLAFHANHTREQIDDLISATSSWAQEMIELELEQGNINKVPKAAKQVYSSMYSETTIA